MDCNLFLSCEKMRIFICRITDGQTNLLVRAVLKQVNNFEYLGYNVSYCVPVTA